MKKQINVNLELSPIKYNKKDTRTAAIYWEANHLIQDIKRAYYTLANNYNNGTLNPKQLKHFEQAMGYVEDIKDTSRIYTKDRLPELLGTEEGAIEWYSLHVKVYNELRKCRAKRVKELGELDPMQMTRYSVYDVKKISEDIVRIKFRTSEVDFIAITDTDTIKRIQLDPSEDSKIVDEIGLPDTLCRLYMDGNHNYLVDQQKPGRLIHRVVVGLDKIDKRGIEIHHINENKLDFRQRNLMIVDRKEHGFLSSKAGKDFAEHLVFMEGYKNTERITFREALQKYSNPDIYKQYRASKGD